MKKIFLGLIAFLAITSNSVGGTFNNSHYYNDLNGSDWHNYSSHKGKVEVIDDGDGDHSVVFTGNGTKTGFYRKLTPIVENGVKVTFSLEFTNYFTIYLQVMTTDGIRYLTYYPLNQDLGKDGKFLKIGLGVKSRNGFFVFKRNVQRDLNKFERENTITEIRAFFIRGSGSMGLIGIYSRSNPTLLRLLKEEYEHKHSFITHAFDEMKDHQNGFAGNNDIVAGHMINWDSFVDFPTFFHILSKDKKSLVDLFPATLFPDKHKVENNTLCNYKKFSDDRLTRVKKV